MFGGENIGGLGICTKGNQGTPKIW